MAIFNFYSLNIENPPSIIKFEPVIYDDAGEARRLLKQVFHRVRPFFLKVLLN